MRWFITNFALKCWFFDFGWFYQKNTFPIGCYRNKRRIIMLIKKEIKNNLLWAHVTIVWFPRPQWVTTHVKVLFSRSAYRKNSKKKFCSIGTWIWPSVDLAELTQGQTLVGSVYMDIDSKILRIEYLWYNKKTFSGLKNIKYNKWSNIKYSITKYYWVIALYWSQTFLKTKVFEE